MDTIPTFIQEKNMCERILLLPQPQIWPAFFFFSSSQL